MSDVVEIESDDVTIEVVQPVAHVIEVITEGPQGPQGPVADQDSLLELVDIAVSDYFVLHPQSFVYDQVQAVFRWSIIHPLDHRPAVTVTDSAGTEYEGEVSWPADNLVQIDFNVPLAGTAVLT